MDRPELPIDALLPGILQEFRAGRRRLILQASPGAGKTTRVPPALLQHSHKQVLVLEPRKLAARLSAERVAQELGERCGETVGFHIRYEHSSGPRTRLKFITEGIFLRMLLRDPALQDVDFVVLDEFHERHIYSDVTLALVRYMQETIRPDLKLVVMSATLDTAGLAYFLPDAAVVTSELRMHPIEIEHLPKPDPRPLPVLVRESVEETLSRTTGGHLLAFLPGVADIRRAAETLREVAETHNCLLLELRAETPLEVQQRVFLPSTQRKIILSTNVAETSLTIDGVTVVIDSGLAKIPGYDPWSGLPQLETRPISQASCAQRAGRAGRTAPGLVRRLYTKHDYSIRPRADKPEIQRLDLTHVLLDLEQIADRFPSSPQYLSIDTLSWLDAPPANVVQGCRELLKLLGALDATGALTDTGREMSALALHPRLSRVIVEGKRLGIEPQALLAAALLNEGMIAKRGAEASIVTQSDVSHEMAMVRDLVKGNLRGKTENIDRAQARRVERLARRLGEMSRLPFARLLQSAEDAVLSQILLAGFPDRVARVRKRSAERIELALCTGGAAVLSRSSTVRDSEYVIALEAEESRGHREASRQTQIRVACGIETETLLAGPLSLLQEEEHHTWDATAERVRSLRRLRYGVLVLEDSALTGNSESVEELLRNKLRERWPKPFDSGEPLQSLQLRAELLKANGIAVNVPDFSGEGFELLLRRICSGKKSFSEIAQRSLQDYLLDLIEPGDQRTLDQHAPDAITIGSRQRRVRVHYEAGKPPWIESWLQDFFGTRSTPAIAGGRIKLVVHLLAPNRRAVQVTQDLESFWTRQYPELRKALSRRYPKHQWP